MSQTCPVIGTGITLGLTNGTKNAGTTHHETAQWGIYAQDGAYGAPVGVIAGGVSGGFNTTVGVTTDPDKSGIVADLSSVSGFAPYFYIKF